MRAGSWASWKTGILALAWAGAIHIAAGATAAPPPLEGPPGHFEFVTRALGSVRALKAAGGHAYAGVNGQLQVFAMADRPRPRLVHEASSLDDDISDIAIEGDRVYVAARSAGLVIYDRSNPARPKRLGALKGERMQPTGLAIDGSLLYAACGMDGIRIVDVSDPSTPRIVAKLNEGGISYQRLLYRAPYLYAADAHGGFLIYDASVPTEPKRLGSLFLPGTVGQIAVSGSLAYLAAGGAGLRMVDLADPRHPVEIGRSIRDDGENALGIALSGTSAFVADQGLRDRNGHYHRGGLRVIDVTDPRVPVQQADVRGDPITVDIEGGRVYTGSFGTDYQGSSSIELFDIAAPARPRRLMSAVVPVSGRSQSRGSDILLANHWLARLNLERLHRPHVEWIRELADPDLQNVEFHEFLLDDDVAYVHANDDTIRIVDLSDIDRPKRRGKIAVAGPAIANFGRTLYVKPYSSQADVQIYDVRSLGNPVLLGTIPDTEDFGSAAVAGHTLYLFTEFWAHDQVMRVYDIAEPSAPVLLSQAPWNEVRDLQVIGDRLYLLTAASQLRIFSLSDGAAPDLLGKLDLDGDVESLRVCGTTVFVGTQVAGIGMRAIDAADPHAPYVAASYRLADRWVGAPSCAANGSVIVYVGPINDGNGGVHVLHYTAPDSAASPR